ncbi:MAG TPA: glycosyltransferase family 2 protein, partial [Kofleriaceae bacterium]
MAVLQPVSMFRQLRVAVVVPAFNEARKISATVASIPDYVDDIFVIDDASTDETSVHASGARATPVHVHRHERNRGVGGAIATGYRHALSVGADVAVVMAGDGQMDPQDLPALL